MDANLLGDNGKFNGTDADDYAGDIPQHPVIPQDVPFAPLNVEDETQYLKWLYTLRVTVKSEGISQADIDTVMAIVAQLKASGAEVLEESSVVAEIASLEHFATKGFTTKRSGLHLVPSLEAIDTGIWATIKVWIAKIVAFLTNLIKEFANRKDDAYFEDKFASYLRAIKKVKTVTAELEYRYASLSLNDLKAQKEQSKKILIEAPLVASKQQLFGFDKHQAKEIHTYGADITSMGLDIVRGIKHFHDLVRKGASGKGMVGDPVFDRITGSGIMVTILKEYASVSPDSQFIAKNVDLDDIYENFKFDDAAVFNFDLIRTHLKFMVEGLKSIGAVRDGGLVEGGLELTEQLTAAITHYQFLGNFYYQTNIMKVVALDTVYRYSNARFTGVYRKSVTTAVTEKVRATIEAVKADLVKQLQLT